MIPFTQTYATAEEIRERPERFKGAKLKDVTLATRLRAELPGILARLVQGCLDWQAQGLNPPTRVTVAVEKYRAAQDILGDVIEDRCEVASGAKVKISALYPAYVAWAETAGARPWTKRVFGRKLDKKGFDSKKSIHRYRIGLRLKGSGA